jgi:hypothetical protein
MMSRIEMMMSIEWMTW